jgi:hypothetical protein
MKFEFPDKGSISKMNKGEAYGSLHSSYAVDYSTEKGRILNSPSCLNVFDESDSASFDDVMVGIEGFNSRWWGVADVMFRSATSSIDDPTDTWALDTATATPASSHLLASMCTFSVSGTKGLYMSYGGDIFRTNSVGSSWSSWWQGTLAQATLSSNTLNVIGVGPTGYLYILEDGNEVYSVSSTGTVDKTGNGTLDFSATEYFFTSMEFTSNRMWLGGRDLLTGKSVVAEWDMSFDESTPNRVYRLSAHGVVSIVIWDDSPVLMLTDGSMRFYNGSTFYKKDGANLPPPPTGYTYYGDQVSVSGFDWEETIMHPKGSDIIDDLPHFLINPKLEQTGSAVIPQNLIATAGVYCYDPEIGLYNRFPIERIGATSGFGATPIGTGKTGVLKSTYSASTKFLASAEFSQNGTNKAVLFGSDNSLTLAARSWFEILSTRFKNSADRILIKYRLSKSSTLPKPADVTWVSTTQFTSTDTDFANVVVGDMVMPYTGNGSGCTAHVSAISYSNPTYTVTLDEAVTGVSASDTGSVVVDNFRRLATISNQQTDYHDISVQNTGGSHTFWLMVELRAAAGSVVELDKIIVTSNDGK